MKQEPGRRGRGEKSALRFNGFGAKGAGGVGRWLLLLLVSIAAAPGADNDKAKFEVKPAACIPSSSDQRENHHRRATDGDRR